MTKKRWNQNSFIEEVNRRGGVEKCRFQIPMRTGSCIPCFGITMVDADGPSYPTVCRITERRYKLIDMHKVEFVPVIASDAAYYQSYYLSDLCRVMERNPERYCFVDAPEEPSNEAPHKLQIEAKQWELFMRAVEQKKLGPQRIGQAFVNTFRLDRVTDRNIYPRIEAACLWELDGEEAKKAIHALCEFA